MCLGVPMRLVSVEGVEGRAEIEGVSRRIRLDLVSGASVGDFVIMHAGFAIQILDEKEARETLVLLDEAFGCERPGGEASDG